MYSEYDRVKDHRDFGERRTVFNGPLYKDEYTRIEPTSMVKMTETGFQVVEGAEDSSKPAPAAESQAPKVIMYSEYERVKDHRTFGDRKTVFAGPLYRDEYQRINPQSKVVMTDAGFKVEEGDAPPPAAEEAAVEE
ncbi:Troponin T [Cichlidogyrus casuarinus]|uniref:Troponin T n=1 Tax=Cichlidogyrus casuarinus TaxID=1844966 RepID=A0ABD2PUJ0_9PLAT